jgi:hypothetical protein
MQAVDFKAEACHRRASAQEAPSLGRDLCAEKGDKEVGQLTREQGMASAGPLARPAPEFDVRKPDRGEPAVQWGPHGPRRHSEFGQAGPALDNARIVVQERGGGTIAIDDSIRSIDQLRRYLQKLRAPVV